MSSIQSKKTFIKSEKLEHEPRIENGRWLESG